MSRPCTPHPVSGTKLKSAQTGRSALIPFSISEENDGVELSHLRWSKFILLRTALAFCIAAAGIFVGTAPGAEHVAFHICHSLILLALAGYVLLRGCGKLGGRSLVPVSVIFAWSLALLITLGAPSRRRQLLNISEGNSEACDEIAAAAWIGLLLISLPLLVDVPAGPLALLGSTVTLQHFLAGVIWPAPECGTVRGGPGGPFLGLAPIWASSLQLLALTAMLAASHRHVRQEKRIEAAIQMHLHGLSNSCDYADMAQSNLERTINQLRHEVHDIEELLSEFEVALRSMPQHVQAWAKLTSRMSVMMLQVLQQVKSQCMARAGTDLHEELFRHISAMGPSGCEEARTVSGWVEQVWAPPEDEEEVEMQAERSNIFESESSEEAVHLSASMRSIGSIAEDGEQLHVGGWEFDAIACSKTQNVLQVVGYHFLHRFPILGKPCVVAFLRRTEESYVSTNPYRSHIHGADMCNSFTFLASNSRIWRDAAFGDTTRIACLIAALGHDMGHFAKTNLFLAASRHQLAITYNDRSVLENMHASLLQRVLEEEGCNLLSQIAAESIRQARQLMITLILGTDSSKHLAELSAFRIRLGADSFNPTSDTSDQQIALGMIFQAADIGHSAKDWPLHEVWSYRVVQEFHEQGDEEKRLGLAVSPLCDRDGFDMAGSQNGFLQYVCLPTFKELANLEKHMLAQTEQKNPCLPQRSQKKKRSFTIDFVQIIPEEGDNKAAVTGLEKRTQSVQDARVYASRSTNRIAGRWSAASGQQHMSRQGSGFTRSTFKRSFTDERRNALPPSRQTSPDNTEEDIEPTIARVCVAFCEGNLEKWRNKGQEMQDPHNMAEPAKIK